MCVHNTRLNMDLYLLVHLGKYTEACHSYLARKRKQDLLLLFCKSLQAFFFLQLNNWLHVDRQYTHVRKRLSGSGTVRAKLARILNVLALSRRGALFASFSSLRSPLLCHSLPLSCQLLFDQLAILREAAFDASHCAIAAHPQFLAHHLNESLVVGHQHHTTLKPV